MMKGNPEGPAQHPTEPKNICVVCGSQIETSHPHLENCSSNVCIECLRRDIQGLIASSQPPICRFCFHLFSDEECGVILGQSSSNIICRFCSAKFTFNPESPNKESSTYDGRKLTDEEKQCAAQYHCLCPACKISCCLNCSAVPFHIGQTCEEHKWFIEGFVCRFCGMPVKPPKRAGPSLALLVCNRPECAARNVQACSHVHMCGHACVGCNGEINHPFCPECTIGGTNCPYCHKQLTESPCVALDCGHVIHRSCAKQIVSETTKGPRLILPLCPVPGCGSLVKHQFVEADATNEYASWQAIWPDIIALAETRIEIEGISMNPEVLSKASPFGMVSSKPALSWAMKNMRFMICRNHSPALIYTLGRVGDPPISETNLCPLCSRELPICPKCGNINVMSFKCDKCCNIGVHYCPADKTQKSGWLCEFCMDMPRQPSHFTLAKCKENCVFAPHGDQFDIAYGYCNRCKERCEKSRMLFARK